TAPSCRSATSCFVGASVVGPGSATEQTNENFLFDPVLLSTTDGGAHWEEQPVPVPDDWPGGGVSNQLTQLACPSADSCVATASVPYLLPPAQHAQAMSVNGLTEAVMRTTDGGGHWAASSLPGLPGPDSEVPSLQPDGGSPGDLTCPSPSVCLTTAIASPAHGGGIVSLAWRSADGGATWTRVRSTPRPGRPLAGSPPVPTAPTAGSLLPAARRAGRRARCCSAATVAPAGRPSRPAP
ncbi:MAG: hypothetical protein ACRDJU_00005, partial [Actinomycetota bacterium]